MNDSFWEKLGSNLAKRDIINEIGVEQFKKMETLERFIKKVYSVLKSAEIEAKYHDEFEKNGIKNLIVSKL